MAMTRTKNDTKLFVSFHIQLVTLEWTVVHVRLNLATPINLSLSHSGLSPSSDEGKVSKHVI